MVQDMKFEGKKYSHFQIKELYIIKFLSNYLHLNDYDVKKISYICSFFQFK